jgi:hypothetical protein
VGLGDVAVLKTTQDQRISGWSSRHGQTAGPAAHCAPVFRGVEGRQQSTVLSSLPCAVVLHAESVSA